MIVRQLSQAQMALIRANTDKSLKELGLVPDMQDTLERWQE